MLKQVLESIIVNQQHSSLVSPEESVWLVAVGCEVLEKRFVEEIVPEGIHSCSHWLSIEYSFKVFKKFSSFIDLVFLLDVYFMYFMILNNFIHKLKHQWTCLSGDDISEVLLNIDHIRHWELLLTGDSILYELFYSEWPSCRNEWSTNVVQGVVRNHSLIGCNNIPSLGIDDEGQLLCSHEAFPVVGWNLSVKNAAA